MEEGVNTNQRSSTAFNRFLLRSQMGTLKDDERQRLTDSPQD
jgi:hypothetical protein